MPDRVARVGRLVLHAVIVANGTGHDGSGPDQEEAITLPFSKIQIEDALPDLVTRYAKTHGPFIAGDISARWGTDVASIDDADGNTLQFAYDDADRIATVTSPSGGIEQHTYNASGKLIGALYLKYNFCSLVNHTISGGKLAKSL